MRNCEKDYILNMTLQYLAYSDSSPTDNPYHRAFDQTRRLSAIPLANPFSSKMVIPPGGSATVFNGVIPNSLNGSSVMSITLINTQSSIYRLQVTSGPAGFKTARAPTGIVSFATATDTVDIPNIVFTAANAGPIGNSIQLVFPTTYAQAIDTIDIPNITFTANTPGGAGDLISLVFNGVAASAVDTIDTPNITFTAINAGTNGNSIELVFDGIASVGYIVAEWNSANQNNQVTYTGLASVVPAAQTINLINGSGTNVSTIVNAWNIANPSNQVSYTGKSYVVPLAQTVNLSGGNGLSVATVVGAWNTANPTNQVTYTGLGTVIPLPQTLNLVAPTNVSVTVNNNAVAVFNFAGATLTGVQVGDIMRISGVVTNDIGPFAFNALNAGLWSVIGISGTAVSVTRLVGIPFTAAAESVAPGPSDVQFYATDGIQDGYKFALTGTFSPVSQRTFVVADATPTWIDFVSTIPLPEESGLTYVPGTMVVYSASKIFVAIEVDQDAVVQFNADTSNNVVINPIKPGTKDLVGSFMKWGNAYACVVVNTSINPLNVKFWTGE